MPDLLSPLRVSQKSRSPKIRQHRVLLVVLKPDARRASAHQYPVKPIRIVVPFAAGGDVDTAARTIGRELAAAWERPIVVENLPGEGARIGTAMVAKAPPDGYSLLMTTCGHAISATLYHRLPYDPVKDFAPIARLGTTSFMLMVRPDFPAKDLKDFLAHVRKQPGKLSAGYGSSGSQVSQAMLRSMGKIDFIDVPYKGLPQAITDVLGGSVSFTFAALTTSPSGPIVTTRSRSEKR